MNMTANAVQQMVNVLNALIMVWIQKTINVISNVEILYKIVTNVTDTKINPLLTIKINTYINALNV